MSIRVSRTDDISAARLTAERRQNDDKKQPRRIDSSIFLARGTLRYSVFACETAKPTLPRTCETAVAEQLTPDPFLNEA